MRLGETDYKHGMQANRTKFGLKVAKVAEELIAKVLSREACIIQYIRWGGWSDIWSEFGVSESRNVCQVHLSLKKPTA